MADLVNMAVYIELPDSETNQRFTMASSDAVKLIFDYKESEKRTISIRSGKYLYHYAISKIISIAEYADTRAIDSVYVR